MKTVYLLAAAFIISFASNAQKKPNILIIVSDDHAYQSIGAYGGKLMKTPSIDRIANEGVKFTRAYVTNSICGPSRAVILTGKHSHINGFRDNVTPSFDGRQQTLPKLLRQSGYQTAWVGKWHLGTKPTGFDFWQILVGQGHYYNPDFLNMDSTVFRVEGYAANIIQNTAEQWLENRDTSKPFCLMIGHNAVHRTWFPDTTDLGAFDNQNFPLPANFNDTYSGRDAARVQDMSIEKSMRLDYDLKMYDNPADMDKSPMINRMNPAQRKKFESYYHKVYEDFKGRNLSGDNLARWKYERYIRDYLATAKGLDRNIGKMLDYLDKHNLVQNTIVIYMSDQGFYLGEHGWFDKRFMYEESFRTPMVMRFPGNIKAATVNNDLVMNLDIAPTVLDAAGIGSPADMQGLSFLPLVTSKKTRTTKGRKAIYYHYYENGEHAVSPHFGIRTDRYKLIRFYNRVEGWELFDLQKDPAEMNNLYGKPGYEKLTAGLKEQLRKLAISYRDDEVLPLIQLQPAQSQRYHPGSLP